jgi:hypothetical protein
MSSPSRTESSELDEPKRWVVRLVQVLSRGLAVDLLWWESTESGPRLCLEGRLARGRFARTSHTFDADVLLDCLDGSSAPRERVRADVTRLVGRFDRRRPVLPR